MRLFVFGAGYSSQAFIARMKDRFEWIGGTTRSHDKIAKLRALGVEPFLFDGTGPGDGIHSALANATHILVSIAPGDKGDPVLAYHAATIANCRPQWLAYLSTVGVYGNHDGAWVDEETPCRPVSRRSIQRLEAEDAWMSLAEAHDLPLAILRLSGIYGPGRNALKNLQQGTARRMIKPGQVFNRIHVEDIAGALEASLTKTNRRIYNVTDDEPAPPQDVVTYAAELMGVAPPPEVDFERADISPMARSFYGENKRVSNLRMKSELGYALQYPDYRSGIRHIQEASSKL